MCVRVCAPSLLILVKERRIKAIFIELIDRGRKMIKDLTSLARYLNGAGLKAEASIIKNSYLVNDMAALKNYLTNDKFRGLEVASLNPRAFFDWLNLEGIETDLDSDDPFEADLSTVPESILDRYLESESWREEILDVDHPSWDCMKYGKIVKMEWLIHFTDDAHAIARNGFTFGVDDLSKLCLTTHLSKASKSRGGYNFAFTADYKSKLKPNRYGGTNYGSEAVMFRANGIEVWHYGDEEYQVIFKGSTARDIIPIWESDGQWFAGDYNKGFDSLIDSVSWIENNFDQYKRLLLSV